MPPAVLVSQTTKKLEEYLSRRLEEFELAALMLDGLEVAGQTVVVTLGITIDGTKVSLGIWLGSTEKPLGCAPRCCRTSRAGLARRCVDSLRSGRRQRHRKALVDVLGDLAVIQRCQIHKLRNLRSYLPKSRHAYVLQTMKEAYKCKSAQGAQATSGIGVVARAKRHDEAAGSLREGMEETLTVVKLGCPPYFASLLPRRTPLRISTNHSQSIEKRQALEESFHGSPMDRSWRRHRAERVPAYQRLSPYGRSRSRA